MDNRSKAILYTACAAILWSTAGLFIKLLPIDAYLILGYRSLFAAMIFIPFIRKDIFKVNKFSIIASVLYVFLVLFFVLATKMTTAANAIFLQYTAPIFVLLAEPFFFRIKLQKYNVWTVIVCSLGMILFFVDQFTKPDSWLGIGLALGSGVVLAGILIVQKLNKPEFHGSAIFWGNILTFLVMTPFLLSSPVPETSSMMYLMILGFGQLGLGYILFVKGQKYLPALESSLIAMLEPLLNPVWVLIGYGEVPGVWALIGGAVIIVSLIVRMVYQSRKTI